jgi:hypothetical protein
MEVRLMARRDLGDRELNWDCYGEDYARIVYDNKKYAMYGFEDGSFKRLTNWYLDKGDALTEYTQIYLAE